MIKKWKKKLAEKAGFTLVELIVVIAILGILAGIAVPMYTGYIKRANDAKVLSELSGVLTTAQAANAMTGNVNEVASITVNNVGVVTVTAGTGQGTSSENYINAFVDLYDEGDAEKQGSGTSAKLVIDAFKYDEDDENCMTYGTSYINGATWNSSTQEWTPVIPASEP